MSNREDAAILRRAAEIWKQEMDKIDRFPGFDTVDDGLTKLADKLETGSGLDATPAIQLDPEVMKRIEALENTVELLRNAREVVEWQAQQKAGEADDAD